MTDRKQQDVTVTPAVARLRGVLKDADPVGEGDYAAHLQEKHLRDGEAHDTLDLFGTLEWDESYDYKLERSRRPRSRRQSDSPE